MVSAKNALTHAKTELGRVPKSAAVEIAALCVPDNASDTHASQVASSGVPVPALVYSLREQLPNQRADWLHIGAMSQDVLDTALCLCAASALDDMSSRLSKLIATIGLLSTAQKETLMYARMRGQLATPITFGLRLAH